MPPHTIEINSKALKLGVKFGEKYRQKVNIRYRGKDYEFIPPVKGTELAKTLLDKESNNVVAVVENNHYIRLSDTVCEDAEIDFVFISSIKGMRVYTSSLFLFY